MNSKDIYIKKRHEFKRDGLAVSQIEHVISNYLKYLKKIKIKRLNLLRILPLYLSKKKKRILPLYSHFLNIQKYLTSSNYPNLITFSK
jgi:hypothetical protein